jgi:Zn-dependent protease/CBS domain-containing protein
VASTSESSAVPQPRGWRVAHVIGVPLHVRASALVAAAVLWILLHAQITPGLAWRAWWVAPLVTTLTSLAFVASVVVHELAHAFVARALHLPVTSVTVFHLGGVTQLGREPEDPRDEAMIAVAGPLVNLLLGGVLLAAGVLLGARTITGGVLVFVGYLNGTIGVFNLLPGHPLDGGALVRAGSWAITGDPEQSLRFSGRLGQGVGGAMVLGGLLGALPGGPVPGDVSWLWLAAIGGFVAVAARAGVVRSGVRVKLAGMRARDLARDAVFEVSSTSTVGGAMDILDRIDGVGLVVDRQGRPVGTFGPRELAAVPSERRHDVTVAESMSPVIGAVDSHAELLAVLPRFKRTRESVLAVVDDGTAVATLAASDVLAHLDEGRKGKRPNPDESAPDADASSQAERSAPGPDADASSQAERSEPV